MAATVVDVRVQVGDEVHEGQPVVVTSAMKMETVLADVTEPPAGSDELYIDTDRNGAITPRDLLWFRQLLAGTGQATKPWAGETLP